MSGRLVRAVLGVLVGAVGLPALVPAALAPPPAVAAGAQPPTPPAGVTRLAVDAVTLGPDGYQVTTSWQAGSATSSFRVSAEDVATGAVLDRASLTGTRWTAAVDEPAGTRVQVAVTPYHDRVRGPASRVSVRLPDLTAPTGTFRLDRRHRVATLAWTALQDDTSARADIGRFVRWGDGSPRERWTGRSLDHRYPGPGLWHPTVRLVDQAGNAAVLPVGAVVVGDHVAPTGVFSASPTAGWATFTRVGITELALHDDLSAAEDIRRSVVWGDGSRSPWPVDAEVEHVYAGAGVFTPRVVLVDEAGNRARVGANPVTVSRDDVAPSVSLHLPTRHPEAARRWRVVHGRAVDVGTGVAVVRVEAVQRRGSGWYAYRPGRGRWEPAASRDRAWRKARPVTVLPTSAGRWLCSLGSVRQGRLAVRVVARDGARNSSTTVHRQLLTGP
ncbi:hypothetical protein [Nocardioides panaciterrulae]|uniref:PKD domain-containing protein n=1 Tax=Nocardioides panaciterrulae TaxID=661492 RepID=A0A7Y9JC69_9ACTN|nr:hypothetical protein [Nocardioides panaciterrulae]NYD42936.1 hypothetical protein [Nocardioides panaciterrulae]